MKLYKNNKIKILLSLTLFWITLSCKNDFDGDLATNPNQLSLNGYYSSPKAVNSSVVGIYSYLTTPRGLGGSGRGMYMHHRSDEITSGSDYAVSGGTSRLSPSFYTFTQPWALLYTAAFAATDVIENIDEVDFGDDTQLKNAYLGEAHTLRAFTHFFLLINWRNILIFDKIPADRSEYIREQSEPMDVWNFIIKDLTTAKGLLPKKGEFWVGETKGRVTSASATGLLGKVYLTMSGIENVDKYTEAAKEFGEIINGDHGAVGLTADYSDNFSVTNENNEESILEFQFSGDGVNQGFNQGGFSSGVFADARGFSPPGLYNGKSGSEAVVHDWVYDAFVTNTDKDGNTDIRMFGTLVFDDSQLANPIPDLNGDGTFGNDSLTLLKGKTFSATYVNGFGEGVYVYTDSTTTTTRANATAAPYKAANRKWMDFGPPNIGGDRSTYSFGHPRSQGSNWRFIRYADILLMYAESVLMGGAETAGDPKSAVNTVRARANMSNLGSVTMTELKTERILELSIEGHRGIDLLRWGELATRMSSLKTSDPNFKKYGGGIPFVSPRNDYLPIPSTELESNHKAIPNPGW